MDWISGRAFSQDLRSRILAASDKGQSVSPRSCGSIRRQHFPGAQGAATVQPHRRGLRPQGSANPTSPELQWPDGPAALRAVLPLARLLRRFAGTKAPPVSSEQLALFAPASAGALREDLTRLSTSQAVAVATAHDPRLAGLQAEMRQFGKLLEDTLLTLAMSGADARAGD